METSSPPFLGVRFVLFGFDPSNELKVRSNLISGGGVDAGQYGADCSHVIVDKIVYDDPVCVAARSDGKAVVTGLWVEHSFDCGHPVDASSVMYQPLKDLNGIPGAKKLLMCLTGYQRQDRDDIMAMVGLMGAQFSKPLVANKVTHLICYKFEGEKYELAKKLKHIQLVNHRWLEDCLRDWELLPEEHYNKSGYELEMMEAEAKDSDDNEQPSYTTAERTPRNLKILPAKESELVRLTGEFAKLHHSLSEPEGPSRVVSKSKDAQVTLSRKNIAEHASCLGTASDAPGCGNTGVLGEKVSVELPEPSERTPKSTKMGDDLHNIYRSAERPPNSDSKYGSIDNMRIRRRSPSSIISGKSGSATGSKLQFDETTNSFSPKLVCNEIHKKGSDLDYEETSNSKRQKTDVSSPSCKLQTPDAETCAARSPSISYAAQLLEPTPGGDVSKIDNSFSLADHAHPLEAKVDVHVSQNSNASLLIARSSEFRKKSPTEDLMSLDNGNLETGLNKELPQTSSEGLAKSNLVNKADCENFYVKESQNTGKVEPQNQLQDGVSSAHKSETDNLPTPAVSDVLNGGTGNLITEPATKKVAGKRTLGSKPKLKSTVNQKGSIFLSKNIVQSNPTDDMNVETERAEKYPSHANELETAPANANIEIVQKVNNMEGETQAPEEKNELDSSVNVERDKGIDLSDKADNNGMEKMSEGPQRVRNMEGTNACEKENKHRSNLGVHGAKKKSSKGKMYPSGKTKTKNVAPAAEKTVCDELLDGEETLNLKKVGGIQKGKSELQAAGQSKSSTVTGKKLKSTLKVEKENMPVVCQDEYAHQDKGHVAVTVVKSAKTPVSANKKAKKSYSESTSMRVASHQVKAEPACFILSGNRLERKQFQLVIRRLKGKCCRDSHQWSYQATHFIAPDPIRRTEKFFAAAAAGKWILKTDYLTACSQAGRFLDEEPYEWHKNGLNEDGAISLEAPRKWRLLRERTGHGAFYGIRIIIYGACIAPPLDTLKRVVKAGDGTILATSPPYSRFLTSGVDYAVISPGMPRVDMWIQEFLKREIPCVVADYLVEYVCKSGYSLDRHVLYNTNAWAEKSLGNLLSRAEEIVDDITPSVATNSDDTACQVCGSRDRGEVMLICGNASGSAGCGAGMHMDCCDPPFEDIPEQDWFCPKCSSNQ